MNVADDMRVADDVLVAVIMDLGDHSVDLKMRSSYELTVDKQTAVGPGGPMTTRGLRILWK